MSVKELSKVEYSKEAWNHLVLDADTKVSFRPSSDFFNH